MMKYKEDESMTLMKMIKYEEDNSTVKLNAMVNYIVPATKMRKCKEEGNVPIKHGFVDPGSEDDHILGGVPDLEDEGMLNVVHVMELNDNVPDGEDGARGGDGGNNVPMPLYQDVPVPVEDGVGVCALRAERRWE